LAQARRAPGGSHSRVNSRDAGVEARFGGQSKRVLRPFRKAARTLGWLVSLVLLLSLPARAQTSLITKAPVAAQPATPADPLGRTTPRGTVLGFLKAARKGSYEAAAGYLDTSLRGQPAEIAAQHLSFVLDRRLPTRLNELSDLPQGSIPFPAKPNLELVGTIATKNGNVDILLQRVDREKAGSLWLFSSATLAALPELYAEAKDESLKVVIPEFLVNTTIVRIPLYQWLALLVGVPAFLFVLGLLNRLISRTVSKLHRKLRPKVNSPHFEILPVPVRLLLLAAAIEWALERVTLPILERQLWSTGVVILTIVACTWLLCRLLRWLETRVRLRMIGLNRAGLISVLRLSRWGAEAIVLLGGLLIGLHHFGVNATAALAGLGIGGVAIALAAQKTLEHVIGGVSIMIDRVVRVGDLVKVGETLGNVEDIGLRSTLIRTFDRSVVSVPNGSLATVTLENLSRRDSFWFHHTLRLHSETTAAQLRSVLEGISAMLACNRGSVRDSIRVRFLGFAADSSLELELFAYITASDWADFLALQGERLLQVMDVVQAAGTRLAPPAQTSYLAISKADQFAFRALIDSSRPQGPKHSRDAA
jgi:MscS family membrane protein